MEENKQEDYILVFEAPKIVTPEFRLYYDKKTGKVITYTCEKLEGDYIIIDSITYAQSRPDVRVIDGKISTVQIHAVVSKLMPKEEGIRCSKQDISIVVPDTYEGDIQKWDMITYEL